MMLYLLKRQLILILLTNWIIVSFNLKRNSGLLSQRVANVVLPTLWHQIYLLLFTLWQHFVRTSVLTSTLNDKLTKTLSLTINRIYGAISYGLLWDSIVQWMLSYYKQIIDLLSPTCVQQKQCIGTNKGNTHWAHGI